MRKQQRLRVGKALRKDWAKYWHATCSMYYEYYADYEQRLVADVSSRMLIDAHLQRAAFATAIPTS